MMEMLQPRRELDTGSSARETHPVKDLKRILQNLSAVTLSCISLDLIVNSLEGRECVSSSRPTARAEAKIERKVNLNSGRSITFNLATSDKQFYLRFVILQVVERV
jgi:hypothetical protein